MFCHIFFFQAEDGIRDDLVTGVQTCALPILMIREMAREFKRTRDGKGKILVVAGPAVVHTGAAEHLEGLIQCGYVDLLFARLEERRVGKECRILGGLGHYEKKKL